MGLPTKSEAAFRLSFRALQGAFPRLYFWTFTAQVVESDRRFGRAWQRFWVLLRGNVSFDFAALRVFQPHESDGPRSGRLHAHMVCNARLSVDMLRRYAKGTGIGQVMKVLPVREGLEDYLCRYMSRQFALFGVRSWAKMGEWDHVLKGNIVVESREADLYRAVFRWTKDWGKTRIICDRLSEWSLGGGRFTLRNWRQRVAENLDLLNLREACLGWPSFPKGEVEL